MTDLLHRVAADVQDHMDAILKNFKPDAKITVLVRFPDKPTADFCMTGDDLPAVADMVRRRMESEGIVRAPPSARFISFVDLIESRALACDGPVTPFLDELVSATSEEKERFTTILRDLYSAFKPKAAQNG